MKILITLGTRPEIIRMVPTIIELKKYHNVVVVYTNQNYDTDLSDVFFLDFGFEPEYKREEFSIDPIDAIGDILKYTNKIIKKENPDIFLILGDTNSCLSALVAKKYRIPVFHIEAGNRSFDENVPEEINRRAIDHISDINICYSEYARENLLREGIKKSTTFVVGSPLYELFEMYRGKISQSKVLENLNLKKNEYILLSIHRQENVGDENILLNFLENIDNYSQEIKQVVIFPVHPRVKNKILNKYKNIKLIKPQNYTDYIFLQMNANMVLSDSGSLTEESSLLGFKAINLRTTNERQESDGDGVLIMTGLDIEKIKIAMKISINHHGENTCYKNINFSKVVSKIIIGYKDYVNKYIYLK
jgi:UDP-N-acetylglucosamine 2-epimerase